MTSTPTTRPDLPAQFVPGEVEAGLYGRWVERGYFEADPKSDNRAGFLADKDKLLALLKATDTGSMTADERKIFDTLVDTWNQYFEADMRTVPGASRLQIRFTLQVRDDATWTRVAAPTFDVWTTAAPGRARYVYDKHVSNLQPGAYRAQVRFRWRDALGQTLKSAVRRSRPCRVPDPHPSTALRQPAVELEEA